ncbi:probable ubiquitin-conjugating enzyme E2 26 isoform X2 [Aristolochia californica]|uniref:probable ubiquitin-conjugating enzyme E2 26 isoform X2 n=1 Tax=Aristolochia californica TaxID=171875 RepID=UPI0035D80DF6
MTPSCAGSTSQKCPEVVDLTVVEAWGPRAHNRKRKQVVSCDVIEIDEDEDQDGVVITGEKEGNNNKATIMGSAEEWQKQKALAKDFLEFKKEELLSGPAPSAALKESQDLDYFEKYHEDYADSDEDAYMNSIEEEDDCLHDNNYVKYTDNIDDLYLSAQLDAVDLPPGQEASFPWLQHLNAGPSKAVKCASAIQRGQSLYKQNEQKLETGKQQETGPCNAQSSNKQTELEKKEKGGESEVERKLNLFKQFDTVCDFSDHHYSVSKVSHTKSFSGGLLAKKVSKDWSKAIQNEWKLLEKDLPDTVFVRVFEERLDLLRAVIIGAAGTPYHDGLFFFDVCFPSGYPKVPPVYYHSGGLRLNPNLYNCGKVCLSLLNTWHGSKNERWTPGKSTMLQVLLSIQALVLNAKPYFNEPGWEAGAGQPEGEEKARYYNETTFILSCKTMMYTLRRPPKHFEDFVVAYFQQRAPAILESCKAYMDGAQVGCLASGGIQDVDEGDKSCSAKFRGAVHEIFLNLIKAFTDNGSDCSKFLNQDVQTEQAHAASSSLTPKPWKWFSNKA